MGRRIASGLICLCLLTSLAQAQAERCTTETLQGRYVFTGRGFIEPGEPGIQRVHYGIFVFDGTGKFSGKQSSSRGLHRNDDFRVGCESGKPNPLGPIPDRRP
jgi:hypothetical protein